MTDTTDSRPTQDSRRTTRRVWTSFVAIALILAVAGTLTVIKRAAEFRALAKETEVSSVLTVAVVRPTAGAANEDLTLPATLQAYVESPIYARTTGYLQKWYPDIGSRVKKGDILADLETPEVDQQLSQAKASRDQTAASLALAKSSAERWANLRKTDSVSQQEADEKQSGYEQLRANLAAADADVRRLEETEGFKHIYAPFAGVVTARNVDTGTLVASGTQQPLFRLAQMDPIRVYVSVPEAYAGVMRAGVTAHLELPQYPGELFNGKVVRTSQSIDPRTRTLLTEVDVPNADGRLLPGGYAQLHLNVGLAGSHLQLPGNTLLFRAEGARVAVVDDGSHVRLHPVVIGRDYGTSFEVLQGITANDSVIINPADSIDEGQTVKVERPAATAGPSGGAAK